jgi:hypothetical protein
VRGSDQSEGGERGSDETQTDLLGFLGLDRAGDVLEHSLDLLTLATFNLLHCFIRRGWNYYHSWTHIYYHKHRFLVAKPFEQSTYLNQKKLISKQLQLYSNNYNKLLNRFL